MKHRNRNLAILQDEDIITVKVRFADRDKEYAYLARKEWGIEVGDFVWVPVLGSNEDAYKPVEVFAIDDEADIDVTQDIYYKFCNGKFFALSAIAEAGIQQKEVEIQKSVNASLRRQMRERLLQEAELVALEAADD